jgi:type 1 glutamine amidotransferase
MLLLLLALLAPAHPDARPPAKPRVLVVTGGHGFQAAPFFKMFDDDSAISYVAAAQGKAAEAFERPDLYEFDAVVLYDSPSEITEPQKERLRGLFARGIGVVVLHHALLSYQKWPEYERIAGAKYQLDDEKVGDKVIVAEATYQPVADIPVVIAVKDHPLTSGVSPFTIHDELYHKLRMRPDVTVLMTTGGEPLLWTRQEGKSRVVGTILGHGRGSYEDAHFLDLLRRSIRWVARAH